MTGYCGKKYPWILPRGCENKLVKEQNSWSTFVVRVGKRKNCEPKFAFCFVLVREKMVEWMIIKR